DRLWLAYPDRGRQARICYHDTTGDYRYDWSSDADLPSQLALPSREPPEVTAWVEIWDGDIRLEVVFTPEKVCCRMAFVDQAWNETDLKDVPLPYEGPQMLDGIERFLRDGGWPVRFPTVATRAASGATAAVLAGAGQWAVEQADCLDFLASLPDGAVQLVIGSPPDPEDTDEWVAWMLRVTELAVGVLRRRPVGGQRGGPRRPLPACLRGA